MGGGKSDETLKCYQLNDVLKHCLITIDALKHRYLLKKYRHVCTLPDILFVDDALKCYQLNDILKYYLITNDVLKYHYLTMFLKGVGMFALFIFLIFCCSVS